MAEFILKDWYGKDCIFNHDTIFVQDVNGELVQFTQGKGESVLESLEVTENGTYTPNEGVDGFNSVNVAVPIPEVVLQDKTITENGTFTADEGFDGLGSVTVDVKGAGGGSLPVGAYWGSYEDIPKPSSYNWSFFELGGELYAFSSKVTASEGIYYKYKWIDGAWVQLEDVTFIDARVYSIRPVEFNGKLHIVPQSEIKYHWTFDGTSVEKKAGFPDYINCPSLFVHNNKLKCFAEKTVYAWDEATDTWGAEATLSLNINYAVSYVVDDVVYIINNGSVYVYDNNTLTLYDSGLNSVSYITPSAVANGKLYYFTTSSTNGHLLYCYDFATKTHSYITKIPNANTTSGCLKSYQNKVLVAPISYQYGTFFQLYEVTE